MHPLHTASPHFLWASSAIIPLPCAAAGVVKMAMQVPLEQQQQQPGVYQEAVSSGSWHSSGSVGPFFAVIAVITVLAALACVLGRVCAGRDLGSESRYDCVGWIERRCRPCVGGDLECGVRVVVEEEVKSKLPESEQKPPESDAKPSENEQPPPPPT